MTRVHSYLNSVSLSFIFVIQILNSFDLASGTNDSQEKLEWRLNNLKHLLDKADKCTLAEINRISRRYKDIVESITVQSPIYQSTLRYFRKCQDKLIAELHSNADISDSINEASDLNDLKSMVIASSRPDIFHTNVPRVDEVGKCLMRYAHSIGYEEDRLEENPEKVKKAFNDFIQRNLIVKCKANRARFKTKSLELESLSVLGDRLGLGKHRFGIEANKWLETRNLCVTLLMYDPYDLHLVSNHNVDEMKERLFDEPAPLNEMMKFIELMMMVTDAESRVHLSPVDPRVKKLHEASRCDYYCDPDCFEEMESLRKEIHSEHVSKLFSYERSVSQRFICEQKWVDFLRGLELVRLTNHESEFQSLENFHRVMMATASRASSYDLGDLLRLTIVRFLFRSTAAQIMSATGRNMNEYDLNTRVEETLEYPCSVLDDAKMLRWNEGRGKPNILDVTNLNAHKWVHYSNICRVYLYEKPDIQNFVLRKRQIEESSEFQNFV